jgi:hypothetical protein
LTPSTASGYLSSLIFPVFLGAGEVSTGRPGLGGMPCTEESSASSVYLRLLRTNKTGVISLWGGLTEQLVDGTPLVVWKGGCSVPHLTK